MTRAAGSSRHGLCDGGCWLVAALGTGACLLGAAPRDGCCWLGRGACVLLRDVPVTAERGAAFLARSARSMFDVCRAEPSSRRSLCPAPRPAMGASFRPRPRRGSSPTRPPGEGCVADPSLASTPPPPLEPIYREAAWRCAQNERRSKRCDRPAAGAAQTRRATVSSPRAACAAASRRLQPNAIPR